ncbi:Helix-turn-helix domain protein [Devosia equisanguinis]|uniref:Helix-turn-helix domain protein n=2 Tax=Devosia equisanguinis TaxID=2490941 RepID=A0A447ID72_9HYPH|nr:Helix-turn-helix domain protein [Devosia equisanguinis]
MLAEAVQSGRSGGWVHRMQTTHLGDATDYLNQRYCGHRLDTDRDHSDLDFRHSAVEIGPSTFNMLQYGSPVSIASEFDAFYMLEMPLDGGVDIEFGSDTFHTEAGLALLLSPGPRFVSHWRAGTRQLMLQIHRDLVRDRMTELARRRPLALPVFNPVIQLRSESGQQVQQVLSELANFAVREEAPDPEQLSRLVPLLVDGMLRNLAFRQGESVVFERLQATPRQVKVAMDLFSARFSDKLNMSDVAREVGVSERSLFDGFQRYYQRSPLMVLTDIRMQEARRLIRGGMPVAEAARRVGMPHAGRFAAGYKRLFGVAPSAERA